MSGAPAKRQWLEVVRGLRPWWLVGWAIAVVLLSARFGAEAIRQDFLEPDNAMRLVQVRDLLAGQSWLDLVQHRLGPPPGVEMHWARWIDGVLALQIAVLRPLVGQTGAEIAVAFIWPFALLAMFLAMVSRICRRLGEADGVGGQMAVAGPVVAALALPAIEKFGPGGFDHHNVELVLLSIAILAMMQMRERSERGGVAGVALGLMLATAAEGAPMLAAGLAIAGLLWLTAPRIWGAGLGWMGAGVAATGVAMFLLLSPAADWGRAVCDTMSPAFLGLSLIAGAVALVLALAPPGISFSVLRRLGMAAALGALALIGFLNGFPECAGGGYGALSVDMQTLWMVQISEARSLSRLFGDDPGLAIGYAGVVVAGLVAAVLYLRKHLLRAEAWILAGFLIMAAVVFVWQIRGAAFAAALAAPFGAWAILRARTLWRANPSPRKALIFAGVAIASTGAGWATIGAQVHVRATGAKAQAAYESSKTSAEACMGAAAMAPLEALPPGMMMNHFALGAAVLQHTRHSVLAAPYHRDQVGILQMIHAFHTAPDAARTLVGWSGADYVLVCPALPETDFYREHPAAGVEPEATLAARLKADDPPDWLTPVPLKDSPLRLYRVVRPPAAG